MAVHKYGIRTPEFFRDHDKLRSYIITENQFKCGLLLCVGNKVTLSRDEVQKVVDYYKTPDGRVHYKEFCDLMENGMYYLYHLEINPLETSPEFIRVGDYGKCMLLQNQIVSNGLTSWWFEFVLIFPIRPQLKYTLV